MQFCSLRASYCIVTNYHSHNWCITIPLRWPSGEFTSIIFSLPRLCQLSAILAFQTCGNKYISQVSFINLRLTKGGGYLRIFFCRIKNAKETDLRHLSYFLRSFWRKKFWGTPKVGDRVSRQSSGEWLIATPVYFKWPFCKRFAYDWAETYRIC